MAEESGDSHSQDASEPPENDGDRGFIDDTFSQSSSGHRFRGPAEHLFQNDRPLAAYDAEEPAKKKVRRSPTALQALQPLGMYYDYTNIMPFAKLLPRISHLVAPYEWFHHATDPRFAGSGVLSHNDFLPRKALLWMQDDDKQLDFAQRFASYGHNTHAEPLRQVARMQQQGPDDKMHSRQTSAVCEVLCAHNVLNRRDELDRQPCADVSDEFVCKGDFMTECKLRGCSMGGLPGLPSVVLFAFEESSTAGIDVSNGILRIFKYWNLAASRPEISSGHLHMVQTETTEFVKASKTNIITARVCVKGIPRDHKLDSKAMLEHVHPDILAKVQGPTVHSERAFAAVDSPDPHDNFINKLFDCQLHVVPTRVRDSAGKTRVVVASILKLRSTVPGCDPVLALQGLNGLQGFEQELVHVAQDMLRVLRFPGQVSRDKLFNVTQHGDLHNLASIGHEANMPLAFFNFLQLQQMSSSEPSPFAADWMGQRIDVHDPDEVVLYKEYLDVVHYSRQHYYAQIALHSSHDQKDVSNSHLQLPTTTVDWKQYYTGQHYRAVPRAALLLDFAQSSPTDEQRSSFGEFMSANTDEENVFLRCDGAPYTRGYVCVMQPQMRSEDNAEAVKLKQQKEFKEGHVNEDELQCVHYCSKRFSMYTAFEMSRRDPYTVFLHPDTAYATVEEMHKNYSSLTSIEREYYGNCTTAEKDNRMQREYMKTKLVKNVYGLSDHPLHTELQILCETSATALMLEHTHDLVTSRLNKQIHLSARAPMAQLKHAARFQLDLSNVDESPPTCSNNESIAHQHVRVHDAVNAGVCNDDAQAARREAQHFWSFQSELNVVNQSVLRWLQLAHVSVWSSTVDDCYGYCAQICDMGNSVRVCVKKAGKAAQDDMKEWDKKMPGSGADMLWNTFGEIVNAFPKFLSRSEAMRSFYSGNHFCQLFQHKTLMAMKRMNGIVSNTRDVVMESMSENNQNMGIVGAMLELNKLEQDAHKVNAIWPNLELGLGQSGSTGRGVKELPYSTTIAGVGVNITVANPLQILLLASNQLSVERPISVNDGSRVVPMTSGCDDALGRIVERCSAPAAGQQHQREPASLAGYTADIKDSSDPRKVDDAVVRRNMSMFLLEFLARIFALMHRGLCLKRHVSSGFGMFLWANTRNYCMHLTTNLRKATYVADDKMLRNVNGSLETAVFSKWARSVLQTALHHRLTQTATSTSGEIETQIRHVLRDAVTVFMLVPISTAVMLSAIQIYLSMVVLDVGVMLVSCMVLYYLKLPHNCPLHVMALVIRGHELELCADDRRRYQQFAEFLHDKLEAGLVPRACLGANFSVSDTTALLTKNATSNFLQGLHTSEPSVYICDLFFPARCPKDNAENPTVSQVLATSFAMTQTMQAQDTLQRRFWSNAGPGTRIPIPHNKSNDRNHGNFLALNECPHFYNSICDKLRSQPERKDNFGVLVDFLRTCDVRDDCSRHKLVLALLRPWADSANVCLAKLETALDNSEDWTRPILTYDQGIDDACMLEWAVRVTLNSNQWEYSTGVGLAVDVLWVLMSQALFAEEWHSSPTERASVVHTRNMSSAAQALLYLYIHTSVPKAAVPACNDGGVVLAEPCQVPSSNGKAICIPYHPRLHVDSGADGAGFLNAAMREARHMRVVACGPPSAVPVLVSRHIQLLDRATNDIGSDVLGRADLCPFPPESVAHLLPVMPCLMRTFRRMHHEFPGLLNLAECQWAVATRLFGCSADSRTLGFLPVALTQHALDEDVPCVSYKHGFCFTLRLDASQAVLTSVKVDTAFAQLDEALVALSTFTRLPLDTDAGVLAFPADELWHAMAGGLVLRDGVAAYDAPAIRGVPSAGSEQIPFAFMPIVRFQALLMLEMLDEEHEKRAAYPDGRRPYPETTAVPLTVAVLNTHAGSSKFLLDGHYHVRYHDSLAQQCEATVDYIFASQCMLCDGRFVFVTFTRAQFEQLQLDCHVRTNRRLAHELPVRPGEGFALQCHYTFSHQPRTQDLGGDDGTHVRIAFEVKEVHDRQHKKTVIYADVALFNSDNTCRLHIHKPALSRTVEHFVLT